MPVSSPVDHLVLNPSAARYAVPVPPSRVPLDFHRSLAGYRPTPLVALPTVARRAGVATVYAKDESRRFGLPAFKILGASWAVHCGLGRLDPADVGKVVLVTATDGNHGRAVARVARDRGCAARVYVPNGTSATRIAAIRSEGATVIEVDGSYDDAVEIAARSVTAPDLLVADTTVDPADETADRVIDGYSTLFHEIADQSGEPAFDAAFVPVGVGALAAAAVRHFKSAARGPAIIGVEPETAACVTRSLRAGEPVLVPGPHPSVMVGLNCGAPSAVAWPELARGLDGVCTIADDYAAQAVALLHEDGLTIGETGAASVGGLLRLADTGQLTTVVPDPQHSTLLVLLTEGRTNLDGA